MSQTLFTAEEIEALEGKRSAYRLVILPAAIFGMWAIVNDWPTAFVGWKALLILFTGYLFLCLGSCLHETAHQTLTRYRWFDVLLGRFLGMITFVPYTTYRETHIRHHAYLNSPSDWELWPYSSTESSLAFRRIFVWGDLLLGSLTTPYIYGRIFFHRDSPLKAAKIRRAIRYEYLASIIFWSVLFGEAAWFDRWSVVVPGFLAPFWLLGVFQTGRKLTEHLGMASCDPLLGTRTVIGSGMLTRFLSYLNFDIFVHGPHHRHPRDPHTQLEDRMRAYQKGNPSKSFPVYTRYRHAMADMLPWLFQNPGVGLNVTSEMAMPDLSESVSDFVSDVSRDILHETENSSDPDDPPQSARECMSEQVTPINN